MADPVIEWLLNSTEPAVRHLTRRDLLDEASPDEDVLSGRIVRALLVEHPGHPYRKWVGAHWRLVSLVELGVPAGEPRAVAATGPVLDWLTSPGHLSSTKPAADGLTRRCASQEGNALAVCCRLGLAGDERVATLASGLVRWQWPDGGWNCDKLASGRRSSFAETLPPMWGLWEYAQATGDQAAADAADRAAELFLSHHVFRSRGEGSRAGRARPAGEPINRNVVVPRYPAYWHYDVVQALLLLGRTGHGADPRNGDAVDLVTELRGRDGRWRPTKQWWRPPGSRGGTPEAVDWGPTAAEMLTLNALRGLRAATRSSTRVDKSAVST